MGLGKNVDAVWCCVCDTCLEGDPEAPEHRRSHTWCPECMDETLGHDAEEAEKKLVFCSPT